MKSNCSSEPSGEQIGLRFGEGRDQDRLCRLAEGRAIDCSQQGLGGDATRDGDLVVARLTSVE